MSAARKAWQVMRTAMRAARMLLTVRKAFPWWLRALLIIGCVQLPMLPTDELALIAAVIVLLVRFRPLLKVCWRAAQMEATR